MDESDDEDDEEEDEESSENCRRGAEDDDDDDDSLCDRVIQFLQGLKNIYMANLFEISCSILFPKHKLVIILPF